MTPITTDPPLFATRVRAGGASFHVVGFHDGLTIGFRPGKGRLVPWSEVVALADGPPADRFGVVVNGRLLLVCAEESEAIDRAADQRQLGNEAAVIRVPVSLPA